MSSKKSASRKRPATSGLDAYLQEHGKTLRTGDQLHLRLIKGPSIQTSPDPVDPKADPEQFPAILKFPVSTAPPDFTQHPWNTARLYQQDVPKHQDSDDEEIQQQQSMRRRRRRVYATPRQWIVQENVDFLESMLEKHSAAPGAGGETRESTSRYEGTPEHNPSRFFLFSLRRGTDNNDDTDDGTVTIQPVPAPHATIAFSQPEVRGTVASLTQAADAAAVLRRPPTQHRLLAKITSSSTTSKEDEGDDVMADVAYTHRKGGGGAARKELLQTMADGIAVSNDGVLGGTDDAAFGARHQRFGNLQASEQVAASGGPTTERGADGAAMADDFYARDVGKEFEEMDYDPNEGEFDDDDVDVGESEIHNVGDDDGGGDYDDEEDEEDDDDNLAEEVTEGAAGLATAKGFKMLLAKARGEAPVESEPGTTADGNNSSVQNRSAAYMANKNDVRDHRSKFRNATQVRKKVVGIHALVQNATAAPTAAASSPAAAIDVQQVDENGLRVITLEAVRREIWLNHGSIGMDRLSKIFSVKKKVPNKNERKDLFKKAVKELCNMNDDPVKGKLLVLKQHYAHMD